MHDVQSVTLMKDLGDNPMNYEVQDTDGNYYSVPLDEENRHYQMVIAWKEAGGTITNE